MSDTHNDSLNQGFSEDHKRGHWETYRRVLEPSPKSTKDTDWAKHTQRIITPGASRREAPPVKPETPALDLSNLTPDEKTEYLDFLNNTKKDQPLILSGEKMKRYMSLEEKRQGKQAVTPEAPAKKPQGIKDAFTRTINAILRK